MHHTSIHSPFSKRGHACLAAAAQTQQERRPLSMQCHECLNNASRCGAAYFGLIWSSMAERPNYICQSCLQWVKAWQARTWVTMNGLLTPCSHDVAPIHEAACHKSLFNYRSTIYPPRCQLQHGGQTLHLCKRLAAAASAAPLERPCYCPVHISFSRITYPGSRINWSWHVCSVALSGCKSAVTCYWACV